MLNKCLSIIGIMHICEHVRFGCCRIQLILTQHLELDEQFILAHKSIHTKGFLSLFIALHKVYVEVRLCPVSAEPLFLFPCEYKKCPVDQN